MINPNKLCPGCMNERSDIQGECPYCGFSTKEYEKSVRCLPPQTIIGGKYLLGKVLGEGGFGITYLAWDLNLDRKLAIKEYFPSELVARDTSNTSTTQVQVISGEAKTYYEKGLTRYSEEAKLLSRFADENGIVSIRDFLYENGTAYIVMDYIDGMSLKEEMKQMRHPYSEKQMLERIIPIISSLEKVHAVGILHRDISPDNIMINHNNTKVQLIDFGAARIANNEDQKSLTIMLKHGYAPEEQYRTKGQQGSWTDVYSICATMYWMLTGEVPEDAMDRLYQDTLKPINKFSTDCSPKVANAIMKGLSVHATGRFQSIEELYRALKDMGEVEEIKEKEERKIRKVNIGNDSRYSKKKFFDKKVWASLVSLLVLLILILLGRSWNLYDIPEILFLVFTEGFGFLAGRESKGRLKKTIIIVIYIFAFIKVSYSWYISKVSMEFLLVPSLIFLCAYYIGSRLRNKKQ